MKSQQIPWAVLMGFWVGLAVWSAVHKGGFYLTIGLLILAIFIGSRYSKNLKAVQAEINRRNPVG